MLKRILALVVVLFLTLNISGQNNSYENTEQPYIEVIGTAELEVVPDEIFIRINIVEKSNNKSKVTIEEQEEKLKKAIINLGIDMSNLSLSDANADYVRIFWKKNVMTKREYLLKVSNANMVEQVFQALENLEIKDVYILRVNHSKLDSIKKVVKIMAIKDAKSKADYLLQAIGEQTGKPLIVKEIETKASNSKESVLNVRGGRSTNNTYFIDGVEMSQNNVIEFEKIKVHCSIYVKFSIK